MLEQAEVDALLGARHPDPFSLLGLHAAADGQLWLRAMLPGAVSVVVRDTAGKKIVDLALRHPDGLFEALMNTWPFLPNTTFSLMPAVSNFGLFILFLPIYIFSR